MKIGSGIVIGKDDAAGASAVRKPPEDRRTDQSYRFKVIVPEARSGINTI
jgi:hypothetical protein